MQIFAFLGPARCGKTTASTFLEAEAKERGYYTERLSFAGPIKDGCERVGVTKENNHLEYRELAQRWGKGRRDRNPLHYIQKLCRSVKRIKRLEDSDYDLLDGQNNLDVWDETVVIIDDVRYQNEVQALADLGAEIIFVHPGLDGRIDYSEEWRQHESEALANKLAQDEDELEAFSDTFDCWELAADGGITQMEKTLSVLCSHLWFDTTFPHLHND